MILDVERAHSFVFKSSDKDNISDPRWIYLIPLAINWDHTGDILGNAVPVLYN